MWEVESIFHEKVGTLNGISIRRYHIFVESELIVADGVCIELHIDVLIRIRR